MQSGSSFPVSRLKMSNKCVGLPKGLGRARIAKKYCCKLSCLVVIGEVALFSSRRPAAVIKKQTCNPDFRLADSQSVSSSLLGLLTAPPTTAGYHSIPRQHQQQQLTFT